MTYSNSGECLRWRKIFSSLFFAALFFFGVSFSALRVHAQEPEEEMEEDNDSFDPVRAAKDMKVGDFYFKKRSYDAAIKRYQDAIKHRPNYAIPYLRIGEAYEKKHDAKSAIEAYKKYLEILPKGKDASYARKRIEQLERRRVDGRMSGQPNALSNNNFPWNPRGLS